MKKILLLLLLTSCLFGQHNFRYGDKWVYEKKSVTGADTITSYVVKELLDSTAGYFVLRVNDYPNNDYSIEEWQVYSGGKEFILQTLNARIYNGDQADFYREEYTSASFSYNMTGTFLDSIITYQYRGQVWYNISNLQTKFSPDIGLLYLYYFHPDSPYANYSYTLKAASLAGKNYGDVELLNLWTRNSFPPHIKINIGDKWVYQKDRIINKIKTTTYIEKVLTGTSGVLTVREFPGNNSWSEKWETNPDSAFITFTSNTFKASGKKKVYSSQDEDYYYHFIVLTTYIYNESDIFLSRMFDYQHRYYYSDGYWRQPTPTQTETIYSPEIGLLYLYHYFTAYDSSHTHLIVHFNDSYTLKAASIGGRIYGDPGLLTTVETTTDQITNFVLEQNYPNPFNPATTINYSIPVESFVELKIYDLLGREVTCLVNKEQSAGEYSVQFNASSLPSGVYVYCIKAGEYKDSKKLLVLK